MRFKLFDQVNRLYSQRVQEIKGYTIVITAQVSPQTVINCQISTGEQALHTADVVL